MQPFNKLTFNSVPNSPAANDTARSNFSIRSSQVHLPRTKQEPCCLIYRCAMQEKDEFFVSSWVVEVEPGRAILEKPSVATDAAEPTYFRSTAVGRRHTAGAWSNR